MSAPGNFPDQVTLELPSWVGGGKPTQFLADAGLRTRPVNGQSSEWLVKCDESYKGVKPSLLTVKHLAGPAAARQRFDELTHLSKSEMQLGLRGNESLVQARLEELSQRGNLLDRFSLWRLATSTAESSQVQGRVTEAYNEIRSAGMEGDRANKPFGHAGVHLIERSPQLLHRAKLASLVLRVRHDTQLSQGDLSGVKQANTSGETIFASSEALSAGLYMLDAYMGPLLGALTPFLWAFTAPRALGLICYSLGRPIRGTAGEPTEMLHLLHQNEPLVSVKIPTLSPGAASSAIDWWVDRLDRIFAVLSDPVVFADATGRYDPSRHLRRLATVEQLFRRVSSIQTLHRDTHAKQVLLFTVLDTLHGLTNRPLVQNCRLQFANKTLDNLRQVIPVEAAEVLLPAAERAVQALGSVQDGFFLGRKGADKIELASSNGTRDEVPSDVAAAQYIELLRNSTHGIGTNRSGRKDLTDSLLAQHRGSLSQDLALLGYLYLLDFLVRPDVLRNILSRSD